MNVRNNRGLSVLELVIVMAIATVLLAVALVSFSNIQSSANDSGAYTITLKELRTARQLAIDRMVATVAILQAPGSIQVEAQQPVCPAGSTGCVGTPGTGSYNTIDNISIPSAPSQSQFMQMGVGSAPSFAPESFGTGGNALEAFAFGTSAGTLSSNSCLMLRFEPNGTIQQITQNCGTPPANNTPYPIASGVIYIARPDKNQNPSPASIRAITIWGATGRIRGYRLAVGSAACGSGNGCSWAPY